MPALLDIYRIPYTFSDPLVMSLTLHKGMTKRVIRDAGVPTADFTVAETPGDARSVAFEPPYFVKPVAEGTGKGVTPESIVRRKSDLEAVCRRLIDAFRQPVIIEPYLPGREFTTGIVGTGARARVLGTIEVHLLDTAEPGVYSYVNKEECESRVVYTLGRPGEDPVVAEAEAVALAAWRALGCRDAGRLDLRCDGSGPPHVYRGQPPGRHPPRAFGPAHHLQPPGDSLSRPDRLDRRIGLCPDSTAGSEDRPPPGSRLMHVAIACDTVSDADAPDARDVMAQADAVAGALALLGHSSCRIACSLNLLSVDAELRRRQVDLVFNLVESLGGQGRLIHLLPFCLDAMGMPYTGARAEAMMFTSGKVLAKEWMAGAGIPTPAWIGPWPGGDGSVHGSDSGGEVWIIKSVWEHASIGPGRAEHRQGCRSRIGFFPAPVPGPAPFGRVLCRTLHRGSGIQPLGAGRLPGPRSAPAGGDHF